MDSYFRKELKTKMDAIGTFLPIVFSTDDEDRNIDENTFCQCEWCAGPVEIEEEILINEDFF